MKNNKGFTLLHFMVVISLTAMVITLLLPTIDYAHKKSAADRRLRRAHILWEPFDVSMILKQDPQAVALFDSSKLKGYIKDRDNQR